MEGKVWKFGNDIDTDVILPGRYLIYNDEENLSKHCMEGLDEDFDKKAQKGDIIVGGTNFGCGSSREHAPMAIKGLGISAVVAESFARIFYRNAINIGLPVITADFDVEEGDIIEVDVGEGNIKNITKDIQIKIKAFDPAMLDILENGGLVKQYLKHNKGER